MIVDDRRHTEALKTSSMLTELYRRMYLPESVVVKPAQVIRVLNQAKIRFVLMGMHGIGGWRDEPRSTQDVDILIDGKDHSKAVKAIRTAFPGLLKQDFPVVTRFLDRATKKEVIDLMKPSVPLLEAAFTHSQRVGRTHAIPTLEMALALKFAAMISPDRRYDKKLQDGADFVNITNTNLSAISRGKLKELGEMVYAGGGDEILGIVDNIAAG
ncbi:MAG: hypothetical protein AB7K24_10035, partial [Gemmataceae bacterium]